MPYDVHGNQLRGGKLKAFQKYGEIDEDGIYMPDGTNIEPEVSALHRENAFSGPMTDG